MRGPRIRGPRPMEEGEGARMLEDLLLNEAFVWSKYDELDHENARIEEEEEEHALEKKEPQV